MSKQKSSWGTPLVFAEDVSGLNLKGLKQNLEAAPALSLSGWLFPGIQSADGIL